MIDGIKARLRSDLDKIRRNPRLEFKGTHSTKTGEVDLMKPPVALYKGLELVDNDSYIEIKGSVHKFFNEGKHNYNDFSISDLHQALLQIQDELDVNLYNIQLVNIEVGLNLHTKDSPGTILNSFILHRGQRFQQRKLYNMHFKECIHSQYYIKVYDKGLQYSVNGNILRCEIKFRKMEKPNEMGIRVLSDLMDINKIAKLSDLLYRVLGEILIGNITITPTGLSKKDRELFYRGHNPDYWASINPNSGDYPGGSMDVEFKRLQKIYERRFKRFKLLLSKCGANHLHEQLLNDIKGKAIQLLSSSCSVEVSPYPDTENQGKLTGPDECLCHASRFEAFQKTGETDLINLEGNNKNKNANAGEIDRLLYSVKSRQSKNQQKNCPITGLNISMQKENSIFLCTSGIVFYKEYYPEIYSDLLKRLSPRWSNCNEKVQIREIHHSIRNQYFNPLNQTRKKIEKLFRYPSLFDQRSLIRTDSHKVASITT